MSQGRFEESLREGMLSLPQDLKAMLRVMDDPDLDDSGRVIASGALLHVLSAANAIPGITGTLAFADDVIVLRMAFEKIAETSPDVVARHREEYPEIYVVWGEQLDAVKETFGELMAVLDKVIDGLPNITHQGHSAKDCAQTEDDGTWLYDSVQEAIVEMFEFDEDEVARSLKSADDLATHLRQRAT